MFLQNILIFLKKLHANISINLKNLFFCLKEKVKFREQKRVQTDKSNKYISNLQPVVTKSEHKENFLKNNNRPKLFIRIPLT